MEAGAPVPFTVDADLDLGETAEPWLRSDGADAVVRRGTVPRALRNPVSRGVCFQHEPDRTLVTWPVGQRGAVRFLVEGGESIRYAVEGDANEADARVFLWSTPWGALCFQRGLLLLHASAVERDGLVHGFAGPAGAGKSTLAMALAERGHPFFADDVLMLNPVLLAREATCWAHFASPKLDLHAAEMVRVGKTAPLRPGRDLRKVAAEPRVRSERTAGRLRTLNVLSSWAKGLGREQVLRLEPLTGGVAIYALHTVLYHKRLAESVLGPERLFEWLWALRPHIQVAGLHRVVSEREFPRVVDDVATTLRS